MTENRCMQLMLMFIENSDILLGRSVFFKAASYVIFFCRP